MPSTTSKGLPYPLGTDRVMDGDDQIRKLAQAVENYVQAGNAPLAISAADTNTTVVVPFPVPYAQAPVVTVTAATGPPASGYLSVWVGNVTAQDVTIGAKRAGASAGFTVNWTAVGKIGAVALAADTQEGS